MCGKSKPDCGCNAAEQQAHNAAHPEDAAEVITASASVVDDTIVAAGPLDDVTGLPTRWHGVLSVEGLRTTDHRLISPMALTWRQLPLAICAQFEDRHGPGDTPTSPIVGSIDAIERDETTGFIMGEGPFDLTQPEGVRAAQMCKNQTLRWNSVDLEILASQYVEVGVEMSEGGGDDILDILFGEEDLSEPADWYTEITDARIMKTTMVSTPAFPQCVMAPMEMTLDIPEPIGEAPIVAPGLLASAMVAIPDTPPASWFKNPELNEATPMEVTNDGRVFGHLALWDTCHVGFENSCVTPPHSDAQYRHFHTGTLACDNGDIVRVGHITFNTGHAGMNLKATDTAHHYDHTGAVAADIVVGEDDFGVWFAGALRPGLTTQDIRAVRAAPLSGDWRKIGGNFELVAALSVNVPGFPIVAAGQRQGEQISLIAAAVKRRDPMKEMAKEIAMLRRCVAPLMGQSVTQLKERVNGKATDRSAVLASLRERVAG